MFLMENNNYEVSSRAAAIEVGHYGYSYGYKFSNTGSSAIVCAVMKLVYVLCGHPLGILYTHLHKLSGPLARGINPFRRFKPNLIGEHGFTLYSSTYIIKYSTINNI